MKKRVENFTEFMDNENQFFSTLKTDPRKAPSAGLIMWDYVSGVPKILLVHPGGPFYVKKDLGHWGIPKGMIEKEDDCKLDTAVREFEEETGHIANSPFISLGLITYKSGKVVYAWVFKGNWLGRITCNNFEMEWPPKSKIMGTFPENDRGQMFTIEEAKVKIMPSQLELINRVETYLKNEGILK